MRSAARANCHLHSLRRPLHACAPASTRATAGAREQEVLRLTQRLEEVQRSLVLVQADAEAARSLARRRCALPQLLPTAAVTLPAAPEMRPAVCSACASAAVLCGRGRGPGLPPLAELQLRLAITRQSHKSLQN
jgi:hypothetical protein